MTSDAGRLGRWWKVTPAALGPYSDITREMTWPLRTLLLSIRRRNSARNPGCGIPSGGEDFQGSGLAPGPRISITLQYRQRPATEAEKPEAQGHSLTVAVRAHRQVGIVRLGERKLRKVQRLLDHVAQRLVVPLAASADAHQPAGRRPAQRDPPSQCRRRQSGAAGYSPPQRKVPRLAPQMLRQCLKQLLTGLLPVVSGLRQLDQRRKIIDELPQFFIHPQTLAGGPGWLLVSRPAVCHSEGYSFRSQLRKLALQCISPPRTWQRSSRPDSPWAWPPRPSRSRVRWRKMAAARQDGMFSRPNREPLLRTTARRSPATTTTGCPTTSP